MIISNFVLIDRIPAGLLYEFAFETTINIDRV